MIASARWFKAIVLVLGIGLGTAVSALVDIASIAREPTLNADGRAMLHAFDAYLELTRFSGHFRICG